MHSLAEMDWLVISLKRTPERLQQFKIQNGSQPFPIEPLEAVDGLSLDRDLLVRDGLIVPTLEWGPGAIGAALSHRQCWLRAVETGRTVGIFEDDVHLRGDFAQSALAVIQDMREDWDLVHFGLNTDSVMEIELFPGYETYGAFDQYYPSVADCERFVRSRPTTAPVKLTAGFGTCAYAVTPKGAKRLLDDCFPLESKERYIRALQCVVRAPSGDSLMNCYYRGMGAYVCMPPIALVPNDKAISTGQCMMTGVELVKRQQLAPGFGRSTLAEVRMYAGDYSRED